MAYFDFLDTNKDCPCRGCDLSCPDTCKAYESWLNNNQKLSKKERDKIREEETKQLIEESKKKTDEYIINMKRKNKYNKWK